MMKLHLVLAVALTAGMASTYVSAEETNPAEQKTNQKKTRAPRSGSKASTSPKATPKAVEQKCNLLLVPNDVSLDDLTILTESHDLKSLVEADPAKNLAVQHPSIIQNAAQKLASWIRVVPPREITEPYYGVGKIQIYPVFSDGVKEAGGKRIVGQYAAIQTVVDYIRAAASGDGAASKMILLVGPPGTGKSEFLGIFAKLAQNLTSQRPEFYVYSFDWINLEKYTELKEFLNLEQPFPSPLNESPFALLPKGYQDAVVGLAQSRAIELSGVKPTPVTQLNPQDKKIREVILATYMKEHGLKSLDAQTALEVLNQHVRIKRVVVGDSTSFAKMNAEGKDVDYAGLFMQPNPLVLTDLGASHPFSYHFNGKVLRANGNFLFLDEFFRNVPELRDVFLEVVENGQVTRGGAPVVYLDAVKIGASNNESIKAAVQNTASRAHLDRTRLVPLPYQIEPFEIAETMLYMKGERNLLQQKLGAIPHSEDEIVSEEHEHESVPANIHEDLFPAAAPGQTREGPDGRYMLWFNTGIGSKPVHISPHTLMFMALTVAGSRLNTNPADAQKFANSSVINTAAFQDVITRLKVFLKQAPINAAEAKELQELSRYLDEGTFGISARDAANVWLTQTIQEAQKPENQNCVTPILAMRVFNRLLQEKSIQYPDNKARVNWMNIANSVLVEFTLSAIRSDVTTAVGSGASAAKSVYDEVFLELVALQSDESAQTFNSHSNEVRQINFDRLREIEEIYVRSEKRKLITGELLHYVVTSGKNGGDSYHKGLLRAVTEYLARRTQDLINFEDLERYFVNGEGNTDIRAKANGVAHSLHKEHGYCSKCMHEAMVWIRQATARTRQVGDH